MHVPADPPLQLPALPVALLPLFMAVLCAIAAMQQGSRALRMLVVGSLASAVSLPIMALRLPDPARSGAGVLLLVSTSLFWLAVCDMMGRRRHPLWALLAPLAWLCLHLCVGGGGPDGGPSLAEVLGFVVVDDAVVLMCLPPLWSGRPRSLSQGCMIGVVASGPALSAVFAVAAAWPGDRFTSVLGTVAVPLQMARSLLWPGLAILTVMDMATRRERVLARQDELSGLLNRRGFFRAVAQMPDRTLLLFDIDHFKRINDTFGHAAGDAAIRRFSHVLTELLGRSAVLGRVGGEEFSAALGGIDPGHALSTAEHVRIAFADGENAIGTGVTVSVGVALAPGSPISVGEQMAAADRALYRAKKAGRNRVESDPGPARIDAVSETPR